jgi:type VI secretion system secreted protein VgrG
VGETTFRVAAPTTTAAGCQSEITITQGSRTATIVLVVPELETPSRKSVTAAELTEAIADVPAEMLQFVARMALNPEANPDDLHWRSQPGFAADHTSAMTATVANGQVTVYPNWRPKARGADQRGALLTTQLIHEAAHLMHARLPPDILAQLRAADASGEPRASNYAWSNDAESFAESAALYVTTKGTPSHDAFSLIMPQRFAAIDAAFAHFETPLPVS